MLLLMMGLEEILGLGFFVGLNLIISDSRI